MCTCVYLIINLVERYNFSQNTWVSCICLNRCTNVANLQIFSANLQICNLGCESAGSGTPVP